MSHIWNMIVSKADFVDAIGIARTRASLRSKGGIKVEPDVTFASCPEGLSIRSSFSAMDIDGEGTWTSPIMAHGASIRQVAPKLTGPTITLRYEAGKLFLNQTSITARDI